MVLTTHLQHITIGIQAALSSSASSSDGNSGVSDLELTAGSGIDRQHARDLQDVNIVFFDFVPWAGTSAWR
jgi:hypothetical protein